MFLAYLLLLTGLTLSAVAIYYSVVGLTAIFSAAVIPIVVMGSSLEVAKLVCASWLKANWSRAPLMLKTYMSIAVVVLMFITSMGIFGFLSKAHNDQNLVSGDVQSKIAVYDEKIAIQKDIVKSSKAMLAQMDQQVNDIMSKGDSEKSVERSVVIRKQQAKERASLQKDIEVANREIQKLNDEAAPIRAEVRKVEAEVGPIKYIAKFIYGDKTDENMLEKAVTWIIILIVVVFDPLAVIMLLAAQMTFAWHRNGHDPLAEETEAESPAIFVADVGEPPSAEELAALDKLNADLEAHGTTPTEVIADPVVATVPYEFVEEHNEPDYPDSEHKSELDMIIDEDGNVSDLDRWNRMIEEAEREVAKLEEHVDGLQDRVARGESYITTDGAEILLGNTDVERPGDYITPPVEEESKKKTYMTKNSLGQMEIKNKQ